MSKIRRKVTVENSKTISDSGSSSSATTSSTTNPAAPSRRPSVFERLGPSTGSNAADSHCRNWLKTGTCSYGNTCRYTHGTQPRSKGFTFSRTTERPTGDLRERMKNKRQDVDPENLKRDLDEPTSPTVRQRDPSRGRHREKEDIKITKEHTPASEEEPAEWETNREDSDIGDYDYELSLEMKRQKIQRELMQLEQENLDKREDIVIKKDETPAKTRSTGLPKVSDELLSSKESPVSRKSSGSPKHKSGVKGVGSGKKEKKLALALAVSETTRPTKASHSKKKGPRTPSPPPPVPLDIPVVGKKHKGKHKNKEKTEEKQKEGKDRGRDTEKHKEKKEKRRDRSESSHKAKRALTSEEHSGSVSSPSRDSSPPARKKSASPKASHKASSLAFPPQRSPSPLRHQRSPTSPRHHSSSSQSGSSAHRLSPSPRRRRSSSPSYHRSSAVQVTASSPLHSRRSRSPPASHDASSPHRRSDRSSPARHHSRGRERSRGDRERTPPIQERRHDHRDESRSKREKDRDDRDYDSEVRDDRETREARERRDARERARETTRDSRDNRDGRDLKDSREIKAETRSSRESLERRDREREKERGREKERSDAYRKEEPPPDDRAYGRGHGRDDGGRTESKMDRTERNGRGRGRANEASDKGSNRNSRSSQLDSGYDNWESRSSTVRDRSAERSGNERGSDRTSDRDRYESDRRDHARDSSYDRRGGHGERDHRDNRDRGSPNRYQRRSEESERDERRTDRAEDRRDDRAREREREREKEKEREREREKEREKEREAERERARERVREREREREREEREREREREEREREREREERERERERKEREREREQRERERQREWEERERGREERRERREDSRDERKMSRKRLRVESSPSPQPLPKRAARDFSPADSDGYNSGEDKSERPTGRGQAKLHPQPLLPSPVCLPPSDSGDKHRLLSQVVRPQDRLSRSPPRSAASSEKATYWKDEDRRGARDKRDARGCHDELETRADRGRGGERRGEYLPDATVDSRGRGRDQRESTPPPPPAATPVGSEDATAQSHEEGKKKTKMQRKGVKKGRKEEDIPVGAAPAPTEPPASVSADVPPPLHSPRKGAKKKGHERKRKRSPGGESDVSEEETAVQAAPSKRKRGPRTPPPSMRPDRHGAATTNTERSPLSKTNNFSDWSDEEESDRGGLADTQAPPPPAERTPAEPLRRVAGHRMGRDRGGAPPIAPLLSPDPPMLLQTLTPQPLMSQPLLRKPPPEPVRSSSMGSNQSRASSRRPRSPSSESAHLDDPQGPRLCRGRLQGSNSRDRDRERERERERERPMVGDPPGAERKSRIDQLRRGEPSRSTSSDRQDSRSHSSRRSSPDSERQGRSRSRAGSYDSREREPFERERDRKDFRPQQNQQQPPPLHLQQPVQPQRDWEPEPRDWPSRGRDPMLMRPGREPLPRGERGERDIRERERLLPEGLVQQHERERERERDRDGRGDRGADRERERVMMDLPPHGDLRAAARGDARGDIMRSDFEPLLPREAFSSPEPEKSSNSHHPAGDQREPEKTESIDGEDDGKEDEQSIASVGEEYEPISDDELDEILADSQKKEDQQEEEKITGPLDVIDVDWSSLMPKQKQEPRAAGAALLRFTPGAVLLRAGISKRLAGPELLEQVKEVCKSELDDPKDTDKLFEHDLGALNMAAVNRRVERAGLLSNLGPCCKALCARRDFAIRRQLLKNEKGQTKQYPTTPVVDNELLQMSIRLFRRTMAGQTSAPERSESGAAPAGEAAETGSSKLSTAQPEVCVS